MGHAVGAAIRKAIPEAFREARREGERDRRTEPAREIPAAHVEGQAPGRDDLLSAARQVTGHGAGAGISGMGFLDRMLGRFQSLLRMMEAAKQLQALWEQFRAPEVEEVPQIQPLARVWTPAKKTTLATSGQVEPKKVTRVQSQKLPMTRLAPPGKGTQLAPDQGKTRLRPTSLAPSAPRTRILPPDRQTMLDPGQSKTRLKPSQEIVHRPLITAEPVPDDPEPPRPPPLRVIRPALPAQPRIAGLLPPPRPAVAGLEKVPKKLRPLAQKARLATGTDTDPQATEFWAAQMGEGTELASGIPPLRRPSTPMPPAPHPHPSPFSRPTPPGVDTVAGMRQAVAPLAEMLRDFLAELRRGQGQQGSTTKLLPHQPTAAPISSSATLPPPNPGGMSGDVAQREALLNASGRLLGNVLPMAARAAGS